jgi:hypothetical protein
MRYWNAIAISAVVALCVASLPAGAETLKVTYGVSLIGLPLGSADFETVVDGSKYSVEVGAKLTGLAGLLTGGKGAATSTGAVSGPQLQPSAFAVTSRSGKEQRTVRMGLNGGNVAALAIMPPLDEKPDRVPLQEVHKRGVVDPISALLMPAITAGRLTDPANCNRTIPVFDGAARFDIVLSYGETAAVDKPGYKGPVLVCQARYVPIAGHRALRPSTKFMEENRDMQVWLAPVEGTRLLVPIKIAVRTMIGMSVVEASTWTVSGDAKVVPTAGKAIRAGAAR